MKRRDRKIKPAQPAPKAAVPWRETWDTFCETAYAVCYVVGTRSVRCVRSAVRFTRVMWRPVAHSLYRAVDWLLLRTLRRLAAEWQALRGGFALAGERVQGKKRRSLVLQLLALPLLAVRRHRAMFRAIVNVTAPLLALLLLVSTVSYWRQAHFALELEYGGEPLGYIADENTYADAAALVTNKVINADDSFQVERAPKLTLSVVDNDEVLDAQGACNAILESMGESLTETAGLYVDNVFRGALPRADLERLKATVLAEHEDKNADHIDFFPAVKIVDGVYPTSAVSTEDAVLAYLKTLKIKSVRYETRTEKLAYTTTVRENKDQLLGYETIVTRGKNGKQRVTEEIITVDGVEQYRSVVSAVVLEKPVEQVIEVGAQAYSEDATPGDGKATGRFIWPVPYTKVVSSPFASRWGSFHGAIDIANGSTNGKPIIACDGGTVIEAEYHHSYGYYVLIDHGNGFKTRYAHCSVLKVKAGQKVAQGEYIANVGNTGYSFGAHLHLEVIKNGRLVDPLDYVER